MSVSCCCFRCRLYSVSHLCYEQTSTLGSDCDGKNTTLIRTSQVAPIVIKNCREEFQHVTDFKEPLVYAKIADNLNEHALIKVRVVKRWIKG